MTTIRKFEVKTTNPKCRKPHPLARICRHSILSSGGYSEFGVFVIDNPFESSLSRHTWRVPLLPCSEE